MDHVVEVTWVAQRLKNPRLIDELSEYADDVIDYTATDVYGDSPKGINKAMRLMREAIKGSIHLLTQ